MIRTLIYAMQSSGASAYAFELGRIMALREMVLCIPDVWHPYLAFSADGTIAEHIIQKVVATITCSLDDHIASFNPDEVILFQRDRADNEESLRSKSYVNEGGKMSDKFAVFNSELQKNRFPVMHYDLMPWVEINQSELEAMRTTNAMLWPQSEDEFGKSWGFGGIHTS